MKITASKRKGILIAVFLIATVVALSFGAMPSAKASAATLVDGGVNAQMNFDYRTIRGESVMTIESSNPLNESYDIINIQDWGAQPAEGLLYLGFKCIAVQFTIDVAEKDDGWQDFYIYGNGASFKISEYSNNVHGPDIIQPNYARYTFYIEISIMNTFQIRYAAHGDRANTWYNKNLKVKIGISNEYDKISTLKLTQINYY